MEPETLRELISTNFGSLKEDFQELRKEFKDLSKENRRLYDRMVECRNHCESARGDLWGQVAELKEYRASQNGMERAQKARGEVDYTFWVKIGAICAGGSVIAFLAISIIQLVLRRV